MTNTRLDCTLPFWRAMLFTVLGHTACAHIDCSHHGHTVVLVPLTEDPFRLAWFLRSDPDSLKTATFMLDFWKQPSMDHGLHSVAVNCVHWSWHEEDLQVRQQVDQLSLNNNRLFSEPPTLLVKKTTNTCGHNSLFHKSEWSVIMQNLTLR